MIGIDISFSEEHSLKAIFLIDLTDDGIVTSVSSLHPLKALISIVVTEEGISIFTKL